MTIVRLKHDGNIYLYQTYFRLAAGDEVIVATRRGGTADGVVVSDSIYVPAIARVVLAYVLSTYRKRPLPWVICAKESLERYEREIEGVLSLPAMDKSTTEGEDDGAAEI